MTETTETEELTAEEYKQGLIDVLNMYHTLRAENTYLRSLLTDNPPSNCDWPDTINE